MILRADAVALDAADPLARFREEFVIPDPSLVYLDGNSLGRTPKSAVARLQALASEQWAGRLISGWEEWLSMPTRVGDQLAPLIGARSGEVVVHDSTSVNLFQLLHAAAAVRPGRRALVVADDEFPSDRYIAQSVAASLGMTVRPLTADVRLDDVAVVLRSLVDYRTAEVADVRSFTAAATQAGALMIWDLSHATGAIEVDVHAAGVELAVGCTYKFLNGGPGTPTFTFAASSLHSQLEQPIHGWWSHHDQFEMDTPYAPHTDIRRFLIGTPPVLALAAAEEGIALCARAGMPAIAAKTSTLTRFGIELCAQEGLPTATPTEDSRRGGHVAIRHPDARTLVLRMATDCHVVADFRPPDIVRLGCSALTTRFTDVYDGVAAVLSLFAATVTVFDDELRESITRNLARHTRRDHLLEGRRHAAVAVLLVDSHPGDDHTDPADVPDTWADGVPGETDVLDGRMVGVSGGAAFVLCRRPRRLRTHPGQWALPGGRLDRGETAVDAALRETHEELGVDPGEVEVLGQLDDYPTRSGFVITPVVLWGGPHLELRPHAAEVAHAYRIGLDELCRADSPRFVSIPESDRPVVQIPLGGDLIHAPTGAVLLQFRCVALDGNLDTRVDHFEQPVFAWR